jgi:hypothetical protein
MCIHHATNPCRCAPCLQEIGGAHCVVLRQDAALGTISTIVLRGSTEGFLDDVERAVNDGVNAYKVGLPALLVMPLGHSVMFWRLSCSCAASCTNALTQLMVMHQGWYSCRAHNCKEADALLPWLPHCAFALASFLCRH